MFDINKTKQHLLNICRDTEELTPETYKKSRIFWSTPEITISLDTEDLKEFNKVLKEIQKDEFVKKNFFKDYLEDKVKDIITEVLKNPEHMRKAIITNDLIKLNDELKNQLEEYVFTTHISNLILEEPLKIGEVQFFKLDENKTKEINEEEIEKQYLFFQKTFGGSNDRFLAINDTYAEVKTYGVKDYAYNLALNKIRLAINIIKLYTHPSKCNFGLDGETQVGIVRKSFIKYVSGEGPYFRTDSVGSHDKHYLSKEFINIMNGNGLNELSKMLSPEYKLSQYEMRLLTGIYWYGEAVSIITDKKEVSDVKRQNELENFEFFNRSEKFLKLFTTLEAVLNFSKKEEVTDNIAERTAKLISNDNDDCINIKRYIKHLYAIRSEMVHNGITYVSKYHLSTLTSLVRDVLLSLIALKKDHKLKNINDLREYIEKMI